MERSTDESAARVRRLLVGGGLAREEFRAALLQVEPRDRDRWLDLVLGTDDVVADGSELPRGCVPYVPCSVDVLLRMIVEADVQSGDVFVDIGAGLGRAAMLTHLVTGATTIGLEIQSHLVRAARDLSQRINLAGLDVLHGDAERLTSLVSAGSVFLLYCPFGGARLAKVLDALESIARTRPIRVCCVDLPLPPTPWLAPVSSGGGCGDLCVYRSTLLDRPDGGARGGAVT